MTATDRDPYTAARRALLPPERVRTLSQLRPGRVLFDIAWNWAVIVACWVAVAHVPTWWAAALAVPVIGTRYYALFIIGHDGLHRRLFARRWLNDLVNDLCVLGPVGAVTRINNHNHLTHHHRLSNADDPDLHKHGCFNKTTPWELAAYLTGVASVGRTLRNVFRPGLSKAAPKADRERYTARDLLILAGWQFALIGGLSYFVAWWAYPVLWLGPVFVFAFLADNCRAFLDHSHPEPDEQGDDHRLITYRSHPVERLFLAPMHMNLHAAHHLWPSIPYYHLPAADRAMRDHADGCGVEWRGTYVGYLWRYLRAMPHVECRPAAEPAALAVR